MRKLRQIKFSYWKVTGNQFFFWISVAFFSGALPNLADDMGTPVLVAATMVAAVVALVRWHLSRRKKGVGVYMKMSTPGDGGSMSRELLDFVGRELGRQHQGWFRSGPDSYEKSIEGRVNWTLNTVMFRLTELRQAKDLLPEIYLYIQCRQRESFFLGAQYVKMREIWDSGPELVSSGPMLDPPFNEVSFSTEVRYISGFKKDNPGIYRINIDDLRSGIDDERSVHVETCEKVSTFSDQESKLAVIIHAADESEEKCKDFQSSALGAAVGKEGTGYIVKKSDLCDGAVSIKVKPEVLYAALRSGEAEPIIRAVLRSWKKASIKLYGKDRVPVRLFMKGPSILAFAAGAALPPGSEVVEFNKNLVTPFLSDSANLQLVAIVDGDDVGTKIERGLLAGELTEVVEESKIIDLNINLVVENLASVPGVSLVSRGGDSGIFLIERGSEEIFVDQLEKIKEELKFKVSCGYSFDCRKAFIALRTAKTSGKNKTIFYS